jgi:hypothetical protein
MLMKVQDIRYPVGYSAYRDIKRRTISENVRGGTSDGSQFKFHVHWRVSSDCGSQAGQ